MLIDIDNFKKYNTCLGYEQADKKLKQLADMFRKLEETTKEEKYPGLHKLHSSRCGGDEYVLVWETNNTDT